jgi:hypothetical protein
MEMMMSGLPEHRVFVGTFHKTGTALMSNIWRTAAERLGFSFWHMNDPESAQPETWHVAFANHSKFGDLPAQGPHRGALIIRDPRDIVISGMHYHRKAREEWLHRPQDRVAGLTYQQKLNDLPNDEERLLFELRHTGRGTIRQISNAMAHYPEFRFVKLEDLLVDEDLMEFHRLYAFLGYTGPAIPALLEIALENSIFSGKVKRSVHVRSGRPAQWKTQFTPRVMKAFLDSHGDLAERWGYEPASVDAVESLSAIPA